MKMFLINVDFSKLIFEFVQELTWTWPENVLQNRSGLDSNIYVITSV